MREDLDTRMPFENSEDLPVTVLQSRQGVAARTQRGVIELRQWLIADAADVVHLLQAVVAVEHAPILFYASSKAMKTTIRPCEARWTV